MTLPEIAREIWHRFGLDLPIEGRIEKLYSIGSDRAGRVLDMAKDIALTESVAQFGGANMEPTQEWRR